MKGLIYKDLLDIKKQYISAIVLQSVFMLSIILIALSSQYGNVGRLLEEGLSENARWTFDYVIGILMLITVIIPLFTIDNFLRHFDMDIKADFRKVSISLPVSIYKKIASRFAGMFIFLALLLCTSFVNAIISAGILSIAGVRLALPFAYILNLILIAALLVIIYMDVCIFVHYLFRNKMAEMWTIGIIVVAGMGIAFYYLINILENMESDNSFEKLVNKLDEVYEYTSNPGFILKSSLICILITVLLYGLSVVVTKMKKEKL